MTRDSSRYRVNTPDVVHEHIDDDVVIINLERGLYYSVSGAGIDLWLALQVGATVDECTTHLSALYDAPDGEVARAAAKFAEELTSEGLLVPSDATAAPQLAIAAGRAKRSFTEPRLEKFDDMRDLLLLDPIHDAGDDGWPNV